MSAARRFTPKEYEAMTDAWLNEGTVAAVADVVGCTRDAAKRLIEQGDASYPPIRERAESLVQRAMSAEDARRVKEIELARRASQKVLADSARALGKMKLQPEGVMQPDGSIEAHERTYAKVVGILRAAVDIQERVATRPQQLQIAAAQSNVNVNVTTGAVETPESVAASCRAFLSKHRTIHAYTGTKEEVRLAAVLAQEASRRLGAQAEPD